MDTFRFSFSWGSSLAAVISCSLCSGAKVVTIENDSLEVAISLQGAELQSIRAKESDTEYLWQGDPEFWERRAIVMFPVNVAFRDWKFTHQGETYEMPFLGLVESGAFKRLRRSNRDEAILEYQNTKEDLERYPFPFRFQIRFSLKGSTLTHEILVENKGTETMYFALGGHPGFRTPLDGGKTRGDYQISFSKKLDVDRIEIEANLQQNSRIPYLNNEDSIALDDPRVPNSGMFQNSMAARRIGVGFKGKTPYVTLSLEDFPNVNMWTPEGMPFVCIEPMLGHHDHIDASYKISEKACVVSLEGGQSGRYRFSIEVNEAVPGP